MSANVEIGKFTLESLTTGMYEQPLIVYREYLQNAADALEDAKRKGIISDREMSVTIKIDSLERTIEIFDNGSGIADDMAANVLLSVGSSQKIHTESRGFRGIGRLGGISYCDKLEFETTACGSCIGIKVSFDCAKLKQLLLPGESTDLTMAEVLDQVSNATSFKVDNDEHYFIVRMLGVDDRTGLLDEEIVTAYLEQNAPVGYSPNFKMLSDHIYSFLSQSQIVLTEFPVMISFDGKRMKPVQKPFSRHYVAGRGKDAEKDTVYEASTFSVVDQNGNLLAIGWYGKSSWLGTLKEDTIRGLRLRKGNIQIGDEHTLDNIFKQARFNGWIQGEVFVVSDDLIPNARRDNFEQNDAYFQLLRLLRQGIGSLISDEITTASKRRNDPVQKAVAKGTAIVQTVEQKQVSGFNSKDEAEHAHEELEQALATLSKAKTAQPEIRQAQEDAVQRITSALAIFDDEPTHYKIDKLKGVLSKKERKILQIASDVMTEYLEGSLLDVIMDNIVDELTR